MSIIDELLKQQQLLSPMASPDDRPTIPEVDADEYDEDESPVDATTSPANPMPVTGKNVVGQGPAGKYFQKQDGVVPAETPLDLPKDEVTAGTAVAPTLSPQAMAMQKYQDLLNQLKPAQALESNQRTKIDMLRGGNQIAQAIASGYGGKIGDGQDQMNSLTKSANEPVQNLLQQIKLAKVGVGGTGSSRSTAVGFGQFVTKSGDPVAMLPDNTLWNVLKQRPVQPGEEVIPRAVDRWVTNNRTQENEVFKPGLSGGPQTIPANIPIQPQEKVSPVGTSGSQTSQVAGSDKSAVPQQTPYDIKSSLDNHDRTILEKDVDQFQKDVAEPKRIVSEIDAISDSTIKLALTNPNAAKTLGAQIAKIMQGSRLTDADIELYTGRTGIANWISDFVTEAGTGTISQQKAKDIRQTLAVYNQALRKSLDVRANQAATIVGQQFNPNLQIDTKALSKLYYMTDKPQAVGGGEKKFKIQVNQKTGARRKVFEDGSVENM